jgi:branched-chain amino acid transport system permease protein
MLFFAGLLVDGALAGAVYAPIALAFVVVYKASRMINFALGEWMMVGTRLVASGLHAGFGLLGAVGAACAGMAALAVLFNRVVLRHLAGRPVIALIMVTLGLGAFLRASGAAVFKDSPGYIRLPLPSAPLDIRGIFVPVDKLVAAGIALGCVALVSWIFQRSRLGVALRAVADDPQVATSVGIDIHRYFAITWIMVGILSVVSGTLWAITVGGGFGVVLVGLKVFPIVIVGGLDSILGTLLGAIFIGILESVTTGYVDPLLGAGFGSMVSYLVLIAVLFIRPYGLLGKPQIARV